jgi:hypothetical protein
VSAWTFRTWSSRLRSLSLGRDDDREADWKNQEREERSKKSGAQGSHTL